MLIENPLKIIPMVWSGSGCNERLFVLINYLIKINYLIFIEPRKGLQVQGRSIADAHLPRADWKPRTYENSIITHSYYLNNSTKPNMFFFVMNLCSNRVQDLRDDSLIGRWRASHSLRNR